MATTTRPINVQQLQPILDRLVGKKIRRVVAGGSAGSIIGVHLGSGAKTETPSGRPEWYLAIECSWRLEVGQLPVTSSRDSNADEGPMLTALQLLVGATLSE